MKQARTSFVLFALALLLHGAEAGGEIPDQVTRKLGLRCHELTGASEALFFPIHHPDNRAEGKLAKFILTQQHEKVPIIIFGQNNPDYAAFVTQGAFSTFSPGTLKGTIVICAVGLKYEKLLRQAVTSTGASFTWNLLLD